jgi:uncharacterized protein (TIGR03435 family)
MVMRLAAFAIPAVFCAVRLAAQDKPQPETFEVVSIKPTPDPPVRTGMFPVPGTLTVNNYPLGRLIMEAMRLKGYQLLGAPPWLDSEHYDIVAKASFPANFTLMLKMLNGVLENRFQLKIHHEQRELPMFALLATKGGVKMKPADEAQAKGRSYVYRPTVRGVEIQAFSMPMRMLADIFSGQLQSPVSDETNLDGSFQFTLEFHPDDLRQKEPGDAAQDPMWVSLYQAVQEQLGLKLEKRRGPVDVVVIDHVEKPVLN